MSECRNEDGFANECIQKLHTFAPLARHHRNYSTVEITEDELVLFDVERMTYHALNKTAYVIWQLADGVRLVPEIRSTLETTLDRPIQPVVVDLALKDLADAGLLEDCQDIEGFKTNRKHAAKLLAAGVIGGFILPSVKSISAPVAAESHSVCPGSVPCTTTSECWAFCVGANLADPALQCNFVTRCCECP